MDVLTLCYADGEGQHAIPLEGEQISIGRSPDQDIVILDQCVSRRHAMIQRQDDGYLLVDQSSSHGTFLNGTRIQRTTLKPNDIIRLGGLNGPKLTLQGPLDERTILHSPSAVTSLLSSLADSRSNRAAPQGAREIEQLNWLLRAARQLNAGGAVDEILVALLQLTLQLTGLERGFVFLQQSDGMHMAHGLCADGTTVVEDSTVSRTAMKNAIESESSFSVSDTLKDERAAEWQSIMLHKIRSIYCIPLRKRGAPNQPGQLLGLLYLDSQIGSGHLSEVDHQLLGTIATEAAALVHNAFLADEEHKARQAREELAVAARIHTGLMSIALPVIPYAVLHAKSVPCLAIGGDFFDAVALPDCLCVTIADVSGKGVSAAIVAATLQGIIHSQLLANQGLSDIATLVNQFLCTRNVGKYATMVMLKLFPDGRVEYINCGHITPFSILGPEVRRMGETNLIVGLIAGATYTSATCALRPGERVLLSTDGLTEAEDPNGEPFGEAGLIAISRESNIDAILNAVERFQAPNLAQDDCTLLDIQYTGAA